MALNKSQAQKLKSLITEHNGPAYFIVGKDMELLVWSESLSEYGYSNLTVGMDTTDVFDFLVGLNDVVKLELPMVDMPNGVHASVSLLREGDELNVLIVDASHDFNLSYLLQQKANDAQLLNYRLQSLLKELVSTQKELEDKNNQLAEASLLQTRFLSGVSHEFRTPLTSIIGYSEVLMGNTDNEVSSHSSVVNGSANYLLSLVENLLDHGRLDSDGVSLQFSNTDMQSLISSIELMLQPLAEIKGLEFTVCLKESAKRVFFIDSVRVQQCIINIVNNALKFTDTGSVELSVDWAADFLTISVVDTGIGMTQEEASNLYAPFWQSGRHSVHGTGLGMTITSKLIDLIGGELNVKSAVNKGTNVEFSIPASLSEDNDGAVLVEGELNEKTILLVEDDDDIAGLVMLRLDVWGYEVERCKNGLDAVNWLQNKSAEMVLMDLNMPTMSGEQAVREIRKNNIKVPIYIMSASPLAEGSGLDVNGQVLKPIDFVQLEKILSEHVHEAGL